RARGGDADGLRRRGRGGRPAPGFRLARRSGRAGGREVRAAAVRARDGGVRRPARQGRAGGDRKDARARWFVTLSGTVPAGDSPYLELQGLSPVGGLSLQPVRSEHG